MNNFITRFVLFAALFTVFGAMSLRAQSFEHDGLRYNVTGENEVEVSGYTVEPVNLVIPATVSYEGTDYEVTGIGERAFYNCTRLVSIDFPDGLTVIELEAFAFCESLVSVYFSESITSIGYGAFACCDSLASVDLPESLTDIGGLAFNACSSLVSVYFPESLTSIGYGVFGSCTSLVSVYFPESLTEIGDYAFQSCTSLTSIDFPDGLTEIGDYAFQSCTSLTSIDFPDGLTEIGDYAFYSCSSLVSVALPDGLTNIRDYAFFDCSSLTSVVVLSSDPLTVGYEAFGGCDSMEEVFLFSHNAIAGSDDVPLFGSFDYTVYTFNYQLPNWLAPASKVYLSLGGLEDEMPYTGKFPDLYIEGNTSSYEMKVDETSMDFNTEIGTHTLDSFGFWLYKKGDEAGKILVNVDLLRTVDYTIVDLDSIQSFEYDGLTYNVTGENEVEVSGYTTRPVNLVIPSTVPYGGTYYEVTGIGTQAFYSCSSLASVYFPEGLTEIGEEAFRDCRSLVSVDFPESLTEIRSYAFFDCISLVSVDFPESLTEIGSYAFFDCNSLVSVALPESLTNIGDSAFAYCSNLVSVVVLSSGSLNFDYEPFRECDSMEEVFLFSHDAIAYIYDAPLFGSFNYTVYSFSDQDLPNWLAPASTVRLSLGGLEERMVYTGVVPDVYIAGNTSSYGMSLDKNSINFDVNAGEHLIDGFSFWLSCEDKEYYVTISDSVDYVIDKAPLTVSAESCETTYGDPLLETFEFMVSYDGFVNGEDATVLSSVPQAICDAGSNPDAGVYPITVSGGDAANYELEYVDGVLIIDKAPLRVSAESFEITYGEPLPEFTLSYDGFVNGEDETVLLSVPQAVCDASSNPDVGEYPIAVSGGDAANYMFHYSDGILKVEKADQIIVWEQSFADTLFVGDVVELTAEADSGLPVAYKSDNENVAFISAEDGKVLLCCVGVGVAEISAYQDGDKNHNAAEDVLKKVIVKDKIGIGYVAASGIGCYPGVADDMLTVSGTVAGASLRVIDLSGAQRMSVACTDGETAVDVSSLAQGMYFVLVEDGGDVAARLRFVKK